VSWFRRGNRQKEAVDPVAWVSEKADKASVAPDRPAPYGPIGGPRSDVDLEARLGGARSPQSQPAEPSRDDAEELASPRSRTEAPGRVPDSRRDPLDDVATESEEAEEAEERTTTQGQDDRERGPWDVSEVPGPEGFVDLGGIWLPGRDGMELRLEVEEQTGRVTAATVALGGSAVQLQAFAAPKSEGIWDEIRGEIAAGVTRQGGTADEMPGPFGKELLARIPVRTPDGRTSHQPARFVGIDGPRWFLRAVFHGPAAYQEGGADDLESLVRGVVVIRGAEAMAPRELLALRLPDAGDPAQQAEPEQTDVRPPLDPFGTGQQIAEIR